MKKPMLLLLLSMFLFVLDSLGKTVECLQTHATFYAREFAQPIIGVKVVDITDGGWAGSVSEATFEFSKKTPIEYIQNIKLWHSATTPYFTPNATQANINITWENNKIKITRTENSNQYSLYAGHYVWLTLELKPETPSNAEIDVKCLSFNIDGAGDYTIENPDPIGIAKVYNFQKRVIPYYRQDWLPVTASGSGWGAWNDDYIDVITEIFHFNLGCDTSGNLTGNSDNFKNGMTFLKQKRLEKNSKMRIILGLGHCDDPMTIITANNELSQKLIDNLCHYIADQGYNGVDIDWEYPDNDAQYNNYINFIAKLKPRLFELGVTFSVAGNSNYMALPAALMHQCDFINFMSYDLGGEHAPINKTMDDLNWGKAQGINPIKLVGGLPFYSNEMRSQRNWDEQQGYGSIISKINPAPNVDRYIKNWGEITGQEHSFNGIDTIQKKAIGVRNSDFGGVMIWCYDGETSFSHQKSLAHALSEILPGRERVFEKQFFYIDGIDGADDNDGLSWATAKMDLQSVISNASANDEIFVRGGVITLNRKLIIPQAMKIYGGFELNGGKTEATQNGFTTLERGSDILETHAVCELAGNSILFENFIIDGKNIDKDVNYGGGILISGQNNTVNNCQVINANAKLAGGGIAIFGSGAIISKTTVKNCKTTANASNRENGGAGIYTTQGGTIDNCVIVENICEGISGASGAAILPNGGSNLKILNSIISSNKNKTQADWCQGAAIQPRNVNNVTIKNCLIRNNEFEKTSNNYGAIYFESSTGICEVINCTIIGNKSASNHSITGNGTVNVNNCLIVNNGTALQIGNYSYVNCAFDGDGEDVEERITVNLKDLAFSTIFKENAYNSVHGYQPFVATETFEISESSPCINLGNNSAYGVNIDSDKDLAANKRFSGISIDIGAYEFPFPEINIKPDENGRVYFSVLGSGDFSGDSWENSLSGTFLQRALDLPEITEVWLSKGDYIGSGENDAFIIPQNKKIYGGFSGTETSIDERIDVSTSNKTVLTKSTQNNLRILKMKNNSVLDGLTISGGSFSQNNTNTTIKGAGIYAEDMGIITNCVIENNTVNYTASGWNNFNVNGLGIYADGILILRNSEIQNNNVTVNNGSGYRNILGVAIYCNGKSTISDCLFFNNIADITKEGNAADEHGKAFGGIYFSGSATNSIIKDSTIKNQKLKSSFSGVYSGNNLYPTAYARGAGIFSEAKISIINTKFENCVTAAISKSNASAEAKGGAIYLTVADSEIRNTIIYNCRADARDGTTNTVSGAGILAENNINIINSNIVKNSSGIDVAATTNITNSVIWGNDENSLVGNPNIIFSAVDAIISGEGNIKLSSENAGDDLSKKYPQFVNPNAGDFSVNKMNSALFNTGTNGQIGNEIWTENSVDIVKNSRILTNKVDIGAYTILKIIADKENISGALKSLENNPISHILIKAGIYTDKIIFNPKIKSKIIAEKNVILEDVEVQKDCLLGRFVLKNITINDSAKLELQRCSVLNGSIINPEKIIATSTLFWQTPKAVDIQQKEHCASESFLGDVGSIDFKGNIKLDSNNDAKYGPKLDENNNLKPDSILINRGK